MSETDSDDELMNRLVNGNFGATHAAAFNENCAYCAAPQSTLPCTTCNAAYYCSEVCKRRHFSAHRAFCIVSRMQEEESEDEISTDGGSESEEEEVHESVRRASSMARRGSGKRGSAVFPANGKDGAVSTMGNGKGTKADMHIPGLTSKQVKKLLELSKKAETMTNTSTIEQLQAQIGQLMAQRQADDAEKDTQGHGSRVTKNRSGSSAVEVKMNEIRDLQKKLQALERKTNTIEVTARHSTFGSAPIQATSPVVYTALLVKDDEKFRKYFKLKDLSMPEDQIKAKMEADGVDASLLDTPDEVSPNDPGPPEGAYIPMLNKDDPEMKKYFKLKSLNMPIDQIKLKMEADGVDPSRLDNPAKVSPNDPGPPLYLDPPAFHDQHFSRMSLPAMFGMSPPGSATSPPYSPMLVKDDPELKKYFKLHQMGMPAEQIKLKMSADGVDATLLDRPDETSPNDTGPPPISPGSEGNAGGPMTMDQLFGILMQHQQIIQQVTSNGSSAVGGGRPSVAMGAATIAPPSVEDQMAKELAAAESMLDDIFGDEQQSKGPGGMSMIEQLEKNARKESNKKLVKHREEINQLVQEVLNAKFHADEEAIQFYNEINPKLEQFGLSLGIDGVQTWSSRLLIKNKDTRDWYYSEKERLDAGKAYGRLWSMSYLDRDAKQLIDKRLQILNAPVTLRSNSKSKVDLIDKFTQLLKDMVKLKHKIFKSAAYQSELQRLHEQNIPERFEERSAELTDATSVLADAALELAEDEFRHLAATTRAKKIRAHTAIHVAEKVIQLVGIVKKLGAAGIDLDRLHAVDSKTTELKEEYLTGEQDEEEEDDVL